MRNQQSMDEIQVRVDSRQPLSQRIATAAWCLRKQAEALGYDLQETRKTDGSQKDYDPTARLALEVKRNGRITYRIWTNSAQTRNYVKGN